MECVINELHYKGTVLQRHFPIFTLQNSTVKKIGNDSSGVKT